MFYLLSDPSLTLIIFLIFPAFSHIPFAAAWGGSLGLGVRTLHTRMELYFFMYVLLVFNYIYMLMICTTIERIRNKDLYWLAAI